MSDYFHISVPVKSTKSLPKIGKVLAVTHRDNVTSNSRTEYKVQAAKHAPAFYMRVITKKKRLEIYGCPAVFLQGHNAAGSNDLRAVVEAIVPLLFASIRQKMSDEVRTCIVNGTYRVHRVDISELHRMPHGAIERFCDHIRRHACSSLQAVPLESNKGIGIRLWPDSRHRRLVIYDKREYFRNRLELHKTRLYGPPGERNSEQVQLREQFKLMKRHVSQGIRIETKFGYALKSLGLTEGRNWTPETARRIHLDALQKIPLTDLPPISSAAALLDTITDLKLRAYVALWLHGEKVSKFCTSRSTYGRYKKMALENFGIDFARAPLSDEAVSWTKLIDASSIIETPAWALESGFVFSADTARRKPRSTHYERVWLKIARRKTKAENQ